jgi:lipopolysaccharide export system protein LptA
MRGARWLLLVLIAAILGGVSFTYIARKKSLREQSPQRPNPLPAGLSVSAPDHYHHTESKGNRKIFDLDAEDLAQSKDSQRVELRGVRLKLYNRDASAYDLVTSAAATLTNSDNRFFSDGDVAITLGIPTTGQPTRRLVSIKSSGISVDPSTGKAETNQPTEFQFRGGTGKSNGAVYDPSTGELLMKANAELNLRPADPKAPPIRIEAGSLTYIEEKSEVWLRPWGRLTRGETSVEGQDCLVRFGETEGKSGERDLALKSVDAQRAHGNDVFPGRDTRGPADPGRKVRYSADTLHVDFDETGVASKVTARGNAALLSTTATAETDVKSDFVEMFLANASGESVLTRVSATGHAVAASKPVAAPGRPLSESHTLRSESIELEMRSGGKEIERVRTNAQGVLEFLPNGPGQHHRTLDASRIAIQYGARNEIETFQAADAKTRTEPTAEEKKRNRDVVTTSSKDLSARFDPKTGRMTVLEQSGDFAYEEGDRHARAAAAVQDDAQEAIVLRGGARVWDSGGSTSADSIRIDQRSGDFTAEGKVNTSRVADRNRKDNPEMLSGDEPIQAQAARMTSGNRGRKARYEGGAAMWQGANRIQADAIEVDKDKRTLLADGHVVTTLWDRPKPAASPGQAKGGQPKTGQPQSARAGAAPARPQATITHAARMAYSDSDRLAVYTGGVTLERATLRVKSGELRAYLTSGGESSLEKAIADGSVEIVQAAAGRPTRTGTGDHAEYFEGEQKLILRGKPAHMVDGSDSTVGLELTYWANDARLLVNGSPKEPVTTRITRDRKKSQ